MIDTYRICSIFACGPHLPIVIAKQDFTAPTSPVAFHALTFFYPLRSHTRGDSVAVAEHKDELVSEMGGPDRSSTSPAGRRPGCPIWSRNRIRCRTRLPMLPEGSQAA